MGVDLEVCVHRFDSPVMAIKTTVRLSVSVTNLLECVGGCACVISYGSRIFFFATTFLRSLFCDNFLRPTGMINLILLNQ